jgi:hypothetical protein
MIRPTLRLVKVCLAALALAILATLPAGAIACHSQPSAPSRFAAIDAKKQEIHALWMQIRAWRVEAGLRGAEPPHLLKMSVWTEPLMKVRSVCESDSEPPAACTDICNLADAICDNADEICRIADELEGDSWAREKCDSAKASCKEAKRRCCDCASAAAGEESAGE